MERVSIVMSTYNRRDLLELALASALAQEWVDLEVVVVDNGSTDASAAFLAAVDDPRVRVLRNERSLGGPGGRNTGLAAATGEWVAVLDDDDLWAPTKLAAQLQAARATGRPWCYAGCVHVDGSGVVLGGRPPLDPDAVMAELPYNYVIPGGISNIVWRREVLHGELLDERLPFTLDWDLSLRLARGGPPAVAAAPLVAYRQHATNHSNRAAEFQAEFDVIESKHADLRHGRPLDRGVQQRFLGSQSLRAGDRRGAALAYLRGARAGDRGSLVRAAALLAPRQAHPLLRHRFLSDPDWVAQAQLWLDALPARVARGATGVG